MFQFTRFPPLRVTEVSSVGFPHSDILDSFVCTQLIEAFRSVPRPSSALDAKAFPVCPCLLCSDLPCGEAMTLGSSCPPRVIPMRRAGWRIRRRHTRAAPATCFDACYTYALVKLLRAIYVALLAGLEHPRDRRWRCAIGARRVVWRACGDKGTRTPDLRLAKAPLSQLSYIPSCGSGAT